MTSPSSSHLAAAWRSDARARSRRPASTPADRQAILDDLALRVGPTTGAHERTLPVAEPFAGLLPQLTRGAVVAIDGAPGAGATSLAFGLAAAATRAGEWAAAVDGDGTLGAEAAQACGVARERAAALVALGAWPADAAWRIRAEGSRWSGFGLDAAYLSGERTLRAHVEGRGLAPGRRAVPLAS